MSRLLRYFAFSSFVFVFIAAMLLAMFSQHTLNQLVAAFLSHDGTPMIDGYCLSLMCPVYSTRTVANGARAGTTDQYHARRF